MRGFYSGLLAGPLVAGQLLDRAGYRPAWAAAGVATAAACGIASWMAVRGRPRNAKTLGS